jgi:hypothetical protein
MMMMMRRLSSSPVRAKPRHLPIYLDHVVLQFHVYIYMYISIIYIYIHVSLNHIYLWSKNTRKILTRPFSMDRTTTSVAGKQLYRLWSVWIWCRAYKRSLTVANRCNKSRLHPRMSNTYYIYTYIYIYVFRFIIWPDLSVSHSFIYQVVPGTRRGGSFEKREITIYIYFTYNSAYFRHTISEDKWCARTHTMSNHKALSGDGQTNSIWLARRVILGKQQQRRRQNMFTPIVLFCFFIWQGVKHIVIHVGQ